MFHFRLLFMLLIISGSVYAQTDNVKTLEFFTGDQDSVIYTKLITDLGKFRKDRNKDSVQRATWGFYLSDNDSVELQVKLTPRGNFRRSHCMITPFKVNFKSADFTKSTVSEYDKLKVVTHCRNTPAYEQNLYVEFLIYIAYQQLTEYSFRVKLLDMKYFNKGKKKTKVSENPAFLIEDVDQVAERNFSVEVETKMLSFDYLDPKSMVMMDFFNFMIGNTDYSIPHLHNVKLLKINDPNEPFPITVPYDFDYSGLINANYAVPNENLGIEKVTDRVYRGVCVDEKYFHETRQIYIDKKDDILNVFKEFPQLEKNERSQTLEYLEDFYNILESDRDFNNLILGSCREY